MRDEGCGQVRHGFGTNGELVEQFLAEIRSSPTDWARLSRNADVPGQRAAVRALSGVSWPAAVLAAVDSAAAQAYGSLGLSRDDFDDPFALGTIKVAISAAVKAIAAGDALAVEHADVLLRPFALEGYRAAAAALGTPPTSPPEL